MPTGFHTPKATLNSSLAEPWSCARAFRRAGGLVTDLSRTGPIRPCSARRALLISHLWFRLQVHMPERPSHYPPSQDREPNPRPRSKTVLRALSLQRRDPEQGPTLPPTRRSQRTRSKAMSRASILRTTAAKRRRNRRLLKSPNSAGQKDGLDLATRLKRSGRRFEE